MPLRGVDLSSVTERDLHANHHKLECADVRLYLLCCDDGWHQRRPVLSALTSHAIIAQICPSRAPAIAPLALAFFQVSTIDTGITAEPITTPINRYTQPRVSPISLRMIDSKPMKAPKMNTVYRETYKDSGEQQGRRFWLWR